MKDHTSKWKRNISTEKNKHTLRTKLHNAVFGRENELEAVKIQFDNACQGKAAYAAIAGDMGIGKTVLIKKVLADLAKLNATCVYGKFEQYRNEEPYIPIIQIITDITNHMLTLPREKLIPIRKNLEIQLGKDGALLTQIVPQTVKITGSYNKSKIIDYQKLKIRLESAFQIFITVAAKELYPLIIAVDDLQWADNPSWNIIKAINDSSMKKTDLYLIFAYRSNLAEYRTKVKSMLHQLAGSENILELYLEMISSQTVKAMLEDVFEDNLENCHRLSQMLHRRTLGNPLYLKQMINLLLDNNELYYNHQQQRWILEAADIRTLELPVDLEDTINRRISSLDDGQKEFMETLVCLGSKFNLELLKKIFKTDSTPSIAANLQALCRAGLVVENPEQSQKDGTGEYEVFHDRVYENVYNQISPHRKEQIHFELATLLLQDPDRIFVEENILSITAHLLHCPGILKKADDGNRLVVDLYFAGLKAKQAAAVEHALKLFRLCGELLGSDCWQHDYENILKIKLELAQCEYLCGQHDAARELFEEMLGHAAGKADRAAILKQYMILKSYTGDHASVIELGLQALKHLGFKISRKNPKLQIAREILHGKLLFRDSRLRFLENAPIVTEQRIVDALEILTIMIASANLSDDTLFALFMVKMGNISARHGNTIHSPYAYAAYSLLLGSVLGNIKKAEKLKEISISLTAVFDDEAMGCAAYFVLGTFIVHWTAPARESLRYLQQAFALGITTGDYLYSGYSLYTMIELKYSMGEPLVEIEKLIKLHKEYGPKMAHESVIQSINIFNEHINLLKQPSDCPADATPLSQEENKDLADSSFVIYDLLKIQRKYLWGEMEDAYALLQKSIKNVDSMLGYINHVDYVFYYLLVSLERMGSQKAKPVKQHQRTLRKFRHKLKAWARQSPENHLARHLLVEALYLSRSKREPYAALLYEQAIAHAGENQNLQLKALANYLAAAYYSSNKKVAKVYAQEAARLFQTWGAVKVANRVRVRYEIDDQNMTQNRLGAAAAAIPETSMLEPGFPADQRLKEYQQELETLELEASFKYFLAALCRETGADYGAILLEKEDQIRLEYEQQRGRAVVKYAAGLDPEEVDYLPKKVLRFAGRTYEDLFIEARPVEGLFAEDEWLGSRAGISIICLPLKYNQIFAGLIYLESQHDHQFNPAQLDFIRRLSFYLLAKQALEKESSQGPKAFINEMAVEQLTAREMEVLSYMAQGLSNNGIGEKLHISSGTVKTHTLNLYRKLEVNSRIQAVTKAQALKLVQ